ncbi:alpha-mannosidase [[Limnothrix rosea] IAM M-220]|uniref:alpha-mannosidase n=1 Tax=[Limnothrix rosea] IAM M-220 TaxID=454133 RepID=UPI000965B00B|nr:alpha-mannosidase [[Limnothrix rosea] IAM M-220]OKH17492.1 alpha-mannosidase [[Limnothrix rosea] IAM M-220]
MSSGDISTFFEQLHSLVAIPTQNHWLYYVSGNVSENNYEAFQLERSQPITGNENGYLVFPKGEQLAWFYQKFTVPHNIKNYELEELHCRLNLTWWAAEAKVFVNGELACEGDLFDSSTRLSLSSHVNIGETFEVAIALISPGHDIGALMKSELIFESDDLAKPDAGFVATELQILSRYLEKYEPEKLPELEAALQSLPLETFQSRAELDQALEIVREKLIPLAATIKERQFHVMGHAHLDMAWLWTTDETWEVGQRTFSSVLNLQKEFSELTFGHSTPALYEWIENNRPDLWQKITEAVAKDKWELLGGMWVEPDVNLVSGESIIRQFLYGQEYFLEKFSKTAPIAWLPDTFGFPQQLPQICKLCGIEAFGTGKLHWNDTKPFPHGLFNWRSPDGTKLLTLMTPPNVTGIMDTNPITMTNYALKWEEQTGLKDIFWIPGVGDHGGGPTKDMIQVAEKWRRSPFFPELKFSTAQQFLNQVKDTPNLPIWDDELYLELHRGYYTVHLDQKQFNRRCETLLRQVELWSAIANALGEDLAHQDIIKNLWKKVLFNQFHDILPGTSIPEVFTEANRDWQYVIDTGEQLLAEILGAIANYIDFSNPPHPEAKPILLFNDLNWERTETISLNIKEFAVVYDHTGTKIPSQINESNTTQNTLSFTATIPSIGYSLYWLVSDKNTPTQRSEDLVGEPDFTLDNDYLRVKINQKTGNIEKLFDKQNQRQVLSGAGNQLQAFEDKGQYWDAWDIAPDYEEKPLPSTELISIQWQEKTKIRSIIRVKRKLNQSTFTQDYILESHSPILKIETVADWQEEQVVLKATFPLTIESNYCDYEVPCGTIRRSPSEDAAKWEVPALRWADLNDGKYGVSIINNSHHGYDAKPNQIRLTLLKSPIWPDPQADRGEHHFSYAIYPHKNTWQEADTIRHAKNFNTPLKIYKPDNIAVKTVDLQSPQKSFFSLGNNSLVLLAFKQSDGKSSWILRFYESTGKTVDFNFQNSFNWRITEEIDALENPLETEISLQIQPWQIKTFRLLS